MQDHLARLLDELMAGIAVRHTDDEALAVSQVDELLCLLRREAKRLLADSMESSFENSLADFVVEAVRDGDRHGLDLIITALCLLGEHRLVVRIAAVRIDAELDAEVLAALRVDVEGTGDEFKGAVAQRCTAMDVANLAAAATADHSPANRMIEYFFTVNHDKLSFSLSLCPSKLLINPSHEFMVPVNLYLYVWCLRNAMTAQTGMRDPRCAHAKPRLCR